MDPTGGFVRSRSLPPTAPFLMETCSGPNVKKPEILLSECLTDVGSLQLGVGLVIVYHLVERILRGCN